MAKIENLKTCSTGKIEVVTGEIIIVSPGHGLDRPNEANPGYIDKKQDGRKSILSMIFVNYYMLIWMLHYSYVYTQTQIQNDTKTNVGSLGELRDTNASAMLIEIGCMDTKEGRTIMYNRKKKLSKVVVKSLKEFIKDRPNWSV